ncbi:MAG: glycosyltransferase [Nitrospirae bacterium]|nr:glycosyltransferase [Nitrospirota bacterium]NTW67098.1 glycosyltransferase [Nitrospirota bacterium]
MADQPLIILFVKALVRGQVKSRLSSALGEDDTLELYKNFCLDILDTLQQTGVPVMIGYYPPGSRNAVAGWLGPEQQYLPQEGRDVGERMENAFRQTFNRGFSRVVLIGSDIPDLPAPLINEALAALHMHDAVIGPARDGGYYLIGFRNDTFFPGVFSGIAWSTGTVFRSTMQSFGKAGQRVHELPLWQDVDTIEDLKDLAARGRRSTFNSSRTMSFLAVIKNTLFPSEVRDANIRL